MSKASAFSSSLTILATYCSIQISPDGIFNVSLYFSAFLGSAFFAVVSSVAAIWTPSLPFKIALTLSFSFRASVNVILTELLTDFT